MPLELEEQPRLIFERNPLELVVAEVRFPPLFALDEASGVAALQSAIRDDFPVAEAKVIERPTGAIGSLGRRMPATGWRFSDRDQQWTVVLTPQALALECRAYRRYEEFRERVAALFMTAALVIPLPDRTRLGIRYVDEIRHPQARSVTDWRRLLRPELLGMAAGDLIGSSVVTTAQQVNLVLPEGKMAIRHGYKSEESRSVYFIDTDAYDDAPQALDITAALLQLDVFKRWSWNFFRASITDELADYLGPRPLS